MGTATLGVQTIAIGAQSLACCPVYGIIAMAVGAVCVAFATAEAQEALGYGNWLKDTVGMSDEVYNGVMIAANIAAIAINIVGVKQCFKEGTLVACLDENGEEIQKPIESIAVGTLVLAYDEITGEKAYKPVVQLSRNTTKEWYHIRMNGEEIVCTGGHPFYVLNADEDRKIVRYEGVSSDKNGRWIEAKELKVSDKLLLSDGSYGIINSVAVETLKSPETTYNFEVEDFHTYFVSDSNVLVHNKCFNPAENSDYYVKYKAEGKTFKAYHQNDGVYKDLFIAKDGYGHGGSSFKLLKEVSGSKLELVGDLDISGKLMSAKHSSNAGIKYLYYGKKFL